MSMLAEKRRKQKWSLNPQGKHWLADSNKFGLKILESMGWKEGKGLGKQQDGITEPIRMAFKNDNKGLGMKETASSMQQDHFHALLQTLNDDKNRQTTPITSLEEKSQKSRTRVHYKKFTRGKDLSKYSAKDLANIFEKKSLHLDPPAEEVDTINKGSMSDYFNNKMPNSFKLERRQSTSDSDNERSYGFGVKQNDGLTNLAFDPLKPTFTAVVKHSLDTISEEPDESATTPKKHKKSKKAEPELKQKTVVDEGKVRKHKKGIDNLGLEINNPLKEDESTDKVKKRKKVNDESGHKDKAKKQKKGIDNLALQANDSIEVAKDDGKVKKRKKGQENVTKTINGIDNPALNVDLLDEEPCDLILNVVEEPVPLQKPKTSWKRKGCDNYGFDVKAQRIEEKVNSISRCIETYQAEVDNDINEIKDVNVGDEDLYVGEFSGCDGENQKQNDGVLLRFKYASFTKDPHWTVRYNQTANLAKRSYKHLIKGDIAVAFKGSNLHEIKGYGLGNKM